MDTMNPDTANTTAPDSVKPVDLVIMSVAGRVVFLHGTLSDDGLWIDIGGGKVDTTRAAMVIRGVSDDLRDSLRAALL